MTNINEMFPSKYQRACELTGSVGTIERVELETMNDGVKKAVAYFQGKKSGFVLNKTRARFLASFARSGIVAGLGWTNCRSLSGTTDLKGEQVATIKFKKPETARAPRVPASNLTISSPSRRNGGPNGRGSAD